MNNSIHQPLYQLIKSALWHRSPDTATFSGFTGEQWELLFKTAWSQGVCGIISDAVFSLPQEVQPPKNIKLVYSIRIENIKKHYYHAGATACAMAAEFSAHKIPMMLMKGLGLADMYPHPQTREFGDLDIYLFGHYKTGNQLAKQQGANVENERGKHSNYFIKGIPVENHQNFLNVKSFKIDRIIEPYLDGMLNDILTRKEYFVIRHPDGRREMTRILLPSPDFNAVFLLRHALTHFGAGNMILRHVCDWACFLDKYHDKVNWKKIRDIFDRANITRFCESFTWMACTYLDMPVKYAVPILQGKLSYGEKGEIRCTDPELETLTAKLFEEIAECRFFLKDSGKNQPKGLGIILYKYKRIIATRWKYDLIYSGGNFWREKIGASILAHIRHPQSIFKL